MPVCKGCGEEVDEVMTVNIHGKRKKLCEECAEEAGMPAELAGMQDLDRILAIDGAPVERWTDITELVVRAAEEGRAARSSIERRAATSAPPDYLDLVVEPVASPEQHYGINLVRAQEVYRTENVVAAIGFGAESSWRFLREIVATLQGMFRGTVPTESMGGIISIGAIS